MALALADRVKETSTSTGTGTISVLGAVPNFRTLISGVGTGNQTYYTIVHQTLAEWEVGIGTVTDATPDTLSRTTVLASSNAGALVNFSAGTKDVFVTLPVAKVALLDLAKTFTALQTFDAGLNVTSGNVVGIGTTNPALYLHNVYGMAIYGATTSGIALATDGTSDKDWLIWVNDDDLKIYESGASHTSGTDRVVFKAGGNVGIGMTPTVQFELSGSIGQKASGTTWSNPSDARLKDHVMDFRDGLDVLRKVRPVHYELNGLAGTPKGQRGISVIAQEMIEAMPYTIEMYTAKLRPEDADETALYRFEASAVTFALVNAVKELDARVHAIERTHGTTERQ